MKIVHIITSSNQQYGYQDIRRTYHITLQAAPCQRKQEIMNKSNQKEKDSNSLYIKVGDQVLLETPGILRKLLTPCTGPYPVSNLNKNCITKSKNRIV
jgi:hypothetical protein